MDQRAFNVLLSGILLSLAGQQQNATRTWQRLIQEFPQKECNGYAAMAQNLLTRKAENFNKVFLAATPRAMLFYLMGMLQKKRGDGAAAEAFFRQSVAEDGTKGLAVCLSAKMLGE